MYVKFVGVKISEIEEQQIQLTLAIQIQLKLPISESKFSGPRKFTFRYQQVQMKCIAMYRKMKMRQDDIHEDKRVY